jgi:hypothetical protein
MAKPLTDYELDLLLSRCPPDLLPYLRRLLEELREMRDQQSEREFFYSQETQR